MTERYIDVQLVNWKERTIRPALMDMATYQRINHAGGLPYYKGELKLYTFDPNKPEISDFEVHDVFALICKPNKV